MIAIADGVQALAAIREYPRVVVVTDVETSVTGLQLCQATRIDRDLMHLPVDVVSDWTTPNRHRPV